MTGIIVATLGGLCAIGITVWWVRSRGKVKEAVEVVEQVLTPSTPSPPKPEDILNKLVAVNVFVRTKGFDQEVLETVERIIDDLREAIPQMLERHPDNELTFNLQDIAEEQLFKHIKEFSEMSTVNQEKHLGNFKQRLADIAEIIHQAREIVDKNEESEFRVIDGFLRTKFSQKMA